MMELVTCRDMNGLILHDTPSSYCIHCFAHQLQLTFVIVAKKRLHVDNFFAIVPNMLNVVGASFERKDLLREHQGEMLDNRMVKFEVGMDYFKIDGFKGKMILDGDHILEHRRTSLFYFIYCSCA